MSCEYDENSGLHPTPPKKNGDWGSWLLIIVMLAAVWPVGLVLLISKLSDSSGKKQAARTAAPKARQTVQRVTKTPACSDKSAKAMKLIGTVLAAVGALTFFSVLGDELPYAVQSGAWWDLLRELFYPAGMLASGAVLLLGSGAAKRRMRRYATCLHAAGLQQAVPIAQLARAADVSEKRLLRDLEEMLEKGLWGEAAYLDRGSGMLFRSQEAAVAYFAAAKAAEACEDAPDEGGYVSALRQIRALNERIDDAALSAKIERLEQVTGSIFKAIEDDERKRAAAGKFLSYYLPTTLKLLENYASLEAAGVSGENLTQAKAKIEKTMDSIVAGFEHQLDELYRSDAMDIDSDIRVMETMLRRDTASVADDFDLGGAAAQQKE